MKHRTLLAFAAITCLNVADIQATEPMVVPEMVQQSPAAGKRVKIVPGEYVGSDVYYSLYLPETYRKQAAVRFQRLSGRAALVSHASGVDELKQCLSTRGQDAVAEVTLLAPPIQQIIPGIPTDKVVSSHTDQWLLYPSDAIESKSGRRRFCDFAKILVVTRESGYNLRVHGALAFYKPNHSRRSADKN